jgi:hypothetical protein
MSYSLREVAKLVNQTGVAARKSRAEESVPSGSGVATTRGNDQQKPTLIPISDAVAKLMCGMFAQLPRPTSVKQAKKVFGERLSVCCAGWKETAAKRVREAAITGELKVYLIPRKRPRNAEPENLQPEIIKLIVSSRGGLPNYPTLVARAPHLDVSLMMRIKAGSLVVKSHEFERWYAAERQRGRWPSQQGRKTLRRGRPRTDTVWRHRIEKIVDEGHWDAQHPVADLMRKLEACAKPPAKPPAKDTVAKLVDGLFLAGDPRYRRPSRKIRSHKSKNLSA